MHEYVLREERCIVRIVVRMQRTMNLRTLHEYRSNAYSTAHALYTVVFERNDAGTCTSLTLIRSCDSTLLFFYLETLYSSLEIYIYI